MQDRPLIGVTTYLATARWGVWEEPAVLLPAAYPALVRAAGGLAVMLPPDGPAAAPAVAARLDALVVSGGPDVDPALYGARRHPRTGPAVPERDRWEAALLRAALAAGLPLLGICRGMQLLNVVCGGTLLQHLPEAVGHEGHCPSTGAYARHLVLPVPGTTVAGLLPEPAVEVPTYHHQAVDRLGAGLRVAARAADGTVEALEGDGPGFVLGVQWHPEQGTDVRLVHALVRAAAGSR
ncbi:gamma-glutamyl-gamma-aminobutyrate hydrolase family protein [Streptacidiphilus sp. ASG 303]|uniref:gamma-glutamyl-gamma-aminobutyrate hydrolase family protein n=1 Tax=Streptacidiphilus sp. ASG 303 TaxID=2896847 RepID=UPI001E5770F7|nr:gamma-glutamyl-gamma-aminobutyrate hydrolase family protein [Streptacidiphilus sp. ASG 303]MCD0481309.1 gamma-glutamyl-gamma-aminobutyrate hydrolase family protein [Streptacidiphilus sp. ASG 303]